MIKTRKNLVLALILSGILLGFQATSFALNCKVSQGPWSADECWTEVMVSSGETLIVSQGHLLVWDSDGGTPAQGSYQVRLARASADNIIAAGFAQGNIATGDVGRVLVYGFGKVRTVGGLATGDYLYAAASGNVAGFASVSGGGGTYVSHDPVGVAFQTSTSNGTAVRWAKIKLI